MRKNHLFLASAAGVTLLTAPHVVSAQSVAVDLSPPALPKIDENGVDLTSGEIRIPPSSLSIGDGDVGLTHSRFRVGNGWRHNYLIVVSIENDKARVDLGGVTRVFDWPSGTTSAATVRGETLTLQSGVYRFIDRDGTEITFSTSLVANSARYYGEVDAVATAIDRPDGKRTELTYKQGNYLDGGQTHYSIRLQSVNSNTGYQLKYNYASDTLSAASVDNWYRIDRVDAINNTEEYCNPSADSCAFSGSWPYIEYSVSSAGSDRLETVTDALGRSSRFRFNNNDRLIGFKRPGESNDGMVISYTAGGDIDAVTLQGSYVRDYTISRSQPPDLFGQTLLSISASDSLGRTASSTANENRGLLMSYTRGDLTWQNQYDGDSRLLSVKNPNSALIVLGYDSRGNITSRTQSGVSALAEYPANCSNPVTCNKPTRTRDELGNWTDYAWDANHGGLTQIERPAPTTGANRPTTSFTYEDKKARYKTGPSSWSNAAPLARLTQTSSCLTAASCNGTVNEAETNYTFANGVNTPNNLEVLTIEQRSGNGSVSSTATYTYDDFGQLSTVDGPLPGSNDTIAYRYDIVGQVIGTTGPDPDGAGAATAPRVAKRYTYNDRGQVTVAEVGTVGGLGDSDWAAFAAGLKETSTYDNFGRVTKQAQVATSGNTQYRLTQYGYDAAGRNVCITQRMNAPTTGSSVPSNACTPATAGTYGGDRIVKRTYDTTDRVTELRLGVGTPLEHIAAEFAYNAAGLFQLEDARGYRTQYSYDNFGRVSYIYYPDKNATGTHNWNDYEHFVYNARGQLDEVRTRADETIEFEYDAIGRLIRKIVPERAGLASTHTRDIYYTYDLVDNLTSARFGGTTGEGILFAYDALGRVTSETSTMDGVNRPVSFGYDMAGNRTSITYPDSQTFTWTYDSASRPTALKHGATSLVTWAYDDLSRVTDIGRYSNAPEQTFGYNAAGQLDEMDLVGKAATSSQWDFTYNPAGEVATSAVSNNNYRWDSHDNGAATYQANGQNQYFEIGTTDLYYDANGNLASDGSTNYTYDIENRLLGATGGGFNASLRYDPLGRLYEIAEGASATRLLYDGQDLIAEYTNGGSLLSRFVHGLRVGDDPLLAYSGSSVTTSSVRFLYGDRLGSIILSTNGSDQASQREQYSYDEFGIPGGDNQGVGAGGEGRFKYTGQVWLPELGLYHYKARAYSPNLGRFVQNDPIRYEDGLNMYAYTGNNPINRLDPSGTQCGYPDGGGSLDAPACGDDIVVRPPTGPSAPPRVDSPVVILPDLPPVVIDFGGDETGGFILVSAKGLNSNDRCATKATNQLGPPGYFLPVDGQFWTTLDYKVGTHSDPFLSGTSILGKSYWDSSNSNVLAVAQHIAVGTQYAGADSGGRLRITYDTGRYVGYDANADFSRTNYVTIILSAPQGRSQSGLPIRRLVSVYPGC